MGSRERPPPSTVEEAIGLVYETDHIMKGHVHDAIAASREQDRREYLEEIKALQCCADPTVSELTDLISRAVETDQRFVRTVRVYAKQGKDGKEKDYDIKGEGFAGGDEPPRPPRKPRKPRKPRLYSRLLMYVWRFIYEVIFWIFILFLCFTIFHRLFMQPEEDELFPSAPPPPNYYAILNISPIATDQEVRRAYRRMALIYHPDKVKTAAGSAAAAAAFPASSVGGKGTKQTPEMVAEERMRFILDAYQTLSGGDERCKYDYYDWPRSEGAVLANTKNGAHQLWQCLVRGRVKKGFNDAKNARNRAERAKQEAKAEEENTEEEDAEAEVEDTEGGEENAEEENVEEAKAEAEEESAEDAEEEDAKEENVKEAKLETEEAKTEEAKTEEAKTEEAKTEEAKTEEAKTEEAKTEEAKTEEAKTEEAKTGAEEEKVEEEETEEDNLEAEKKEDEEEVRGSAAPKQDMAEGGSLLLERFLKYAEKAAAAYHILCYSDAVARTGLFALVNAITWKFGVELPDICLGGR
ncbi:Cell cycle control protein (Cwf23) [Apiospora marii]|uniref:Cell cycle control protein (Cwf23) n=1 Tax=Apiospora marii TaxID=335849 RepID=UPI0031313E94